MRLQYSIRTFESDSFDILISFIRAAFFSSIYRLCLRNAASIPYENFRKFVQKFCGVNFKSDELSEDSYIGLGCFFCFFFQKKVLKCSNNYRCAFIHIRAFINAERVYAF